MRQTRLWVAIALMHLMAFPAVADEMVDPPGAGGMEFLHSDAISVLEQDLRLSVSNVRTRFVFRNDSDADVKTFAAFVLPDMAPEDRARGNSGPLAASFGFTLFMNARAIQPQSEVRAIMDGKDVTHILKLLGIVPDDAGRSADSFTPTQRAALEKLELLRSPRNDMAGWDTRLRFYWEQDFPAGKPVEISYAYVPFLGTENISSDTIARVPAFTDSFCMTAAQRELAGKRLAAGGAQAYYLEHVRSTRTGWTPQVGRLVVTIERQLPDDIFFTCLPGLKPDRSLARNVVMTDAKPAADIGVLFIGRAQR